MGETSTSTTLIFRSNIREKIKIVVHSRFPFASYSSEQRYVITAPWLSSSSGFSITVTTIARIARLAF